MKHDISRFPKTGLKTLANPTHTGMGTFAQLVEDSIWISGAIRAVKHYGAAKYFTTLLAELRRVLALGKEQAAVIQASQDVMLAFLTYVEKRRDRGPANADVREQYQAFLRTFKRQVVANMDLLAKEQAQRTAELDLFVEDGVAPPAVQKRSHARLDETKTLWQMTETVLAEIQIDAPPEGELP